MLTGLYAARNVVGEGERGDVWSVNADKSYHETGGDQGDTDALPDRSVPMPRGSTK